MAGLYSPATLQKIRDASDIVEVVRSVLPLKAAGANWVALCPFHKEKSPSFNVNPSRQIFHCFGCHKGGDVFTFVKEYENISFVEAVQRLAERARIPIETESGGVASGKDSTKSVLLAIHEQIAKRWQSALANDAAGEIARAYLAKRGVSSEAIKLFGLGYAPDSWDDTVNWTKSKGFELSIVEKAGLIIRKEERFYDRFRGRLMFPICDEQGRIIAFSGRVLAGDEKTAKYVNSPETDIFKKSKVFYGLDKSRRPLLDAETAIICEGQLDLIACFMAGVQNVVAPQGTAFTEEHARILKRYVKEVILCFDSDTAGQTAAIRVLDSLLASGLAIRVATLPTPHDPDSYIKEFGADSFRQLVSQAPGFFDFYLNHLCQKNDIQSDRGQTEVTQNMAEAVYKTGNVVLADKYAQKTALRLGVSMEATRTAFKKHSRSNSRPAASEESEAPNEETASERPLPHEFWLLKLVLINDDLLEWLAAHLDVHWVRHPGVRQILSLRIASAGQPGSSPADLLIELEDLEIRSLCTEALASGRPIPNPEQQVKDLVTRMRNETLDKQLSQLTLQAGEPSLNDQERLEILHQQQAIRAFKRQPLSPLPDVM